MKTVRSSQFVVRSPQLVVCSFLKLITPNSLLRTSFLVLFCLCSSVLAGEPIVKTSNEILPMSHEFLRDDGDGWLASGETIGAVAGDYEVKIYERDTGTETTTTMISDVSVTTGNGTRSKVLYKLKAGTAGKTYRIKIKVKTSASNTFEDWVDARVI